MHDDQKNAEHEEDQARFEELQHAKEAEMDQEAGEQLTLDDYEDCQLQVLSEAREKRRLTSATRTKTGEINDYLETRRPWGTAQ